MTWQMFLEILSQYKDKFTIKSEFNMKGQCDGNYKGWILSKDFECPICFVCNRLHGTKLMMAFDHAGKVLGLDFALVMNVSFAADNKQLHRPEILALRNEMLGVLELN